MSPFTTRNLKPLSARRSATLSVLDVGTNKIVCLVAELKPTEGLESLKGRTHLARIIGIGHQRSLGIKAGVVVDLDAAEMSIRQAVHAAERMARVEIQSVIVSMTGGRIGSQHFEAEVAVRNPVSNNDLYRVLETASRHDPRTGRIPLHALPTGFKLDDQRNIVDPTGMIGEKLGVDLHVVSAENAATRNLMLAVERCHLGVEAVIATPYASGLSALVDDEAEMGCAVIDLGAGTTSTSVFANGYLVHTDVIAVGAHHVTMDIARGLSTRVAAAERIKTLYGATISSASDDRDLIAVPRVDDNERDTPHHISKAHLVRIIRPRVEEILELVRDRLRHSGFLGVAGRRIVLTGGGSQLVGVPELTRQIFKGQVRIGRPLGIKGLPEAAKGPAFSASVGMLVYPQVAHIEYFELRSSGFFKSTGTDGYLSRMGRWLKDSF